MGYHLRAIQTVGEFGQPSKIREELEELEEAFEQRNKILIHCELADLYGAIEAVAVQQGLTMEDVKKMSDATARAFRDGQRTPKKPMCRHCGKELPSFDFNCCASCADERGP